MDREIYIGENGLEKQIMQDLERTANPADGLMTVNELVGGLPCNKNRCETKYKDRICYCTENIKERVLWKYENSKCENFGREVVFNKAAIRRERI